MNSLYTNEVREFLSTREWPVDPELKWMVVEKFEPYQYLQFVLFRHNINEYEPGVMVQLSNTINEMFMHLRASNVPIYLEVKP